MRPFNMRPAKTQALSGHQMSTEAQATGDKAMNTRIATFAAVTLTAALVSGIVYSAPTSVPSLTHAAFDNEVVVSASQKVRCIMPPAQQKYCGA